MDKDTKFSWLPNGILPSDSADTITLSLSRESLTSNMQCDSAAFESWAVAIRSCAPDKYIEIATEESDKVMCEWMEISNQTDAALHFRRFIYRLNRFRQNYEWVKVDNKLQKLLDEANDWKNLVLNYPVSDARPIAYSQEAKLEREYISRHSEVNQQLPVGIFLHKKSNTTRITPGGKSAIDLWSIDDNILSIYELKADGNNSLGIISELFFYANVMKDLMIDGKIKYDETDKNLNSNDYRGFKKLYRMYREKRCKGIKAIFLCSSHHRLLTDDLCEKLSTDVLKFSIQTVDTNQKTYKETERQNQISWIQQNGICANGIYRGEERDYCLEDPTQNLFPGDGIAEKVNDYFQKEGIAFWGGSQIPNHTLSSQVQCLNFLFAIRKDRDLVSQIAQMLLGKSDITAVQIPEKISENNGYISFEVTSASDHLNEKTTTRGANCTSIDALIVIEDSNGYRTLIPIEWKYTESYDNTDKSTEADPDKPCDKESKGEVRLERYSDLINKSCYLVHNKEGYRKTLFFIEPFYQLMRQTLWANQMIKHKDTEQIKADDYMHIHVVSPKNAELLAKHYQYANNDGMENVWRNECLTDKGKNRYKIVSQNDILRVIEKDGKYANLAKYLRDRYGKGI